MTIPSMSRSIVVALNKRIHVAGITASHFSREASEAVRQSA